MRLDPRRSSPDEFELRGETLYLSLPNGVAHSKLTNSWFDSTLGVVSTIRNWATVTRLAQLLDRMFPPIKSNFSVVYDCGSMG